MTQELWDFLPLSMVWAVPVLAATSILGILTLPAVPPGLLTAIHMPLRMSSKSLGLDARLDQIDLQFRLVLDEDLPSSATACLTMRGW